MTENELRERIDELERLRVARLADVNALGGAIQDCEFWLGRLTAPAEPSKPRLVEAAEPPTN